MYISSNGIWVCSQPQCLKTTSQETLIETDVSLETMESTEDCRLKLEEYKFELRSYDDEAASALELKIERNQAVNGLLFLTQVAATASEINERICGVSDSSEVTSIRDFSIDSEKAKPKWVKKQPTEHDRKLNAGIGLFKYRSGKEIPCTQSHCYAKTGY
jgi:hypothetical protein